MDHFSLSKYFEHELHPSTTDEYASYPTHFDYEDFSSSTTEQFFEYVEHSLNITKPSLKTQLLLYDILIPALGTIIILLNFAVVVSSGLILKKGSQPRSTYLFLGNVAMCDLVTGIAVVFGQMYPKHARTQSICAFQLGMIVSSTVASIYSVGLIAIDRYLYIIHGLQYQRWVYPTRARLLILSTWIIGCIVGFLPIMGWSGDTQNGRVCWFIKLVPPKLVMTTCIIGLIPILVVIVLYSIILYHALKKIIQLRRAGKDSTANANCETGENKLRIFVGRARASESSDTEVIETGETQRKENMFTKLFVKKKNTPIDLKAPSKGKAIKVVLFVTGSFVITWVPYFVASAIFVNCDPKVTPEKCKSLQVLIASPLAILGFCNSLLNPIIYAWWHKGFRTFVKKMICKKGLTKSPPTSSGTKSTTTHSSKKNSVSSISNQSDNNIQLVSVQLNTHM